VNLLYLSAFVPWPVTDGDKVRAMTTLRLLARKHRVFGFFLQPEGVGDRMPAEVAHLCRDHVVCPIGRLERSRGTLRSILQRKPVQAGSHWSPRVHEHLVRALTRWRPDAVHVHRLRMMPYAERLGLPYNLDHTDCLSHYFKLAKNLPGWRKWYARLDLKPLSKAERLWGNNAAACLVITDNERRNLRALGIRKPVHVVPNWLDMHRWSLAPRPVRPGNFVFIGNMAYPPNIHGLEWFLDLVAAELVRLAPGSGLDVVGGGTPPSLMRKALLSPLPVRFLGFQADVRGILAGSAGLLCPLPIAAGLQNKVIQAFARGTPVVSTRNVARFAGARPSIEILASDNPAGFARQAARLIHEPALGRRLAAAARRLAISRFSEKTAGRAMNAALADLAAEV
jgi:glycosyltransferase involved in cell wall biosynthesis